VALLFEAASSCFERYAAQRVGWRGLPAEAKLVYCMRLAALLSLCDLEPAEVAYDVNLAWL
jgi:hypothetical protein